MTVRSSERGNALIVTVISMSVMMLLVLGAIRFTGANREAAVTRLAGEELEACTEAARALLLSQLQTFEVPVTDLRLNEVLGTFQVETAHYAGADGGTTPVVTVVPLSASAMGASRNQVRDLSNTLPDSPTLGGKYYRVVVKCQLSAQKESELEFVFRHGL